MQQAECEDALAEALHHPRVLLLLAAIHQRNSTSLSRGITCRPCRSTLRANNFGYYDPNFHRIVLCSDMLTSPRHVLDTLIHELVHAYDASRRLGRRFGDDACAVIACTEIRASMLGQCQGMGKRWREKCVRRAAEESVRGVRCEVEWVSRVWGRCAKDSSPFSASQV